MADASREATVITAMPAEQDNLTKVLMINDSGYSDVRGLATRPDTRWGAPFNCNASHDISWSFRAKRATASYTNPACRGWTCPRACGRAKTTGAASIG
ncbi:MAG: hypothetical protein ONB48_21550 [candidate division KSB1 bacterium]|nr:hypothetical protein [candidate division KSB1 bacterium]MDZ7276593.1 hypothetical protein [candidate division KSB1 bacterium]MDZ7288234.1 hypothetical protein [candidate division KSB1 bacterium]MDZ7300375.1 hypothetical protein [candidate division KSB1 bacterium]MDZ7307807.1 hypothetical protein [candidate division KSB1 bacterium]